MAFDKRALKIADRTLKALKKEVEGYRKQWRFAAMNTLNTMAFDSQRLIREEMRRKFDKPLPYTIQATRVTKATKRDLRAQVYVKDRLDAGKGTPPEYFLLPQIDGGERRQKRHEIALQRIGVLPAGWRIVPGEAADLDAAGNMKRGQIVQILSYFRAFGEQGYRANSTTKTRARLRRGGKNRYGKAYFVAYPGRERTRHLTPGVYMRQYSAFGSALRPVMIFVRTARYSPRIDWWGIQRRYFQRNFAAEFERELDRALRTAR